MDKKEAQEHLTEARDCIDNLSPNFSSAGEALLNSIAKSLLVIASVVADIEFKDENHFGCMEGKNNGGGRNGGV